MEASQNPSVTNRKAILTVSIISSLINPFMGAAVNIALPRIGREFSMDVVWISWIAMSFLLSLTVMMVPIGKLADIYGRKRMFLYGNIVVAVSSVLCAISGSGMMLLFFRVLQGLGSAMIFGTAMAIVTSVFPPNERGKVIGYNVTAVYIGLSISPVLGGFLTQALGWRSLFFLTVPIALFNAVVTYVYIKQEWFGVQNEPFDYKGSIIYILSMSAFMFGFSKIPDIYAVGTAFAGMMGLAYFVRFELRQSFPVLNMQLFKYNKIFAFSNLAALINYAATFAISFVLSLYLQYVKGLPPGDAGLLLITQPVVMAVFASVAGRLSDKHDSRILSSIGMSVIVVGLICLAFLNGSTHTPFLIYSLVILGMGFGIFSSPNTNAIMSSVEHKYLGIASASVSTMRVTGQMMSMGIATLIIHIFIGASKISAANIPFFISSLKVIFIVFAILCAAGVFASLAGKKVSDEFVKRVIR